MSQYNVLHITELLRNYLAFSVYEKFIVVYKKDELVVNSVILDNRCSKFISKYNACVMRGNLMD